MYKIYTYFFDMLKTFGKLNVLYISKCQPEGQIPLCDDVCQICTT